MTDTGDQIPYDVVHQKDDGKWYFEKDGADFGPYESEIGAREGLRVMPTGGWMDALPGVSTEPTLFGEPIIDEDIPDDAVEIDPEAAEHRLSHATQDLVEAAIALIRNSKTDILVRKEDMKLLRARVNEFDLAYAEVVTVGKIMALAVETEAQPALGDNVVEPPYITGALDPEPGQA